MNLETKITIYKFTPQVFTLTLSLKTWGNSHLHLHSKGFFPEIEVQDFPIRGKAVYLRVKRRRWENPEIPQIVTLTRKQDNISDSSKLCSECFNFSDCPDKYFLPAILGRIIARTLHKKRDVSILTHLFHIY